MVARNIEFDYTKNKFLFQHLQAIGLTPFLSSPGAPPPRVELSYPLSTLCILFSLFPLFFRVHVGADPEEIIKVGKEKTKEEEKILAAEITAAVTVLSLSFLEILVS
jgi:hypothetical protein